MTIVKPLYGHTSLETAYCADDYPYGRLRTKMYFWLESKPKFGVRLVSQSLNPKTGRMNKPHPGQYVKIAGNMYLDENGHCQWAIVSEYSTAEQTLDFIKAFPETAFMKDLMVWCKMKYGFHRVRVDNKRSYFTINGVESEYTESECERDTKEMRVWWRAFNVTQQKPEETPEPEAKK
jgi:hypothetical protein